MSKTTTAPASPQKTAPAPAPIWNKVAFTGHLGRDPEMIYTPTGKAVTKFSIAVNQGKDKDPIWLDIVCWQDLAEEVHVGAAKGTQVEVRGRLTQESWRDKDGKTRRALKVIAETVAILRSTRAATEDASVDLDTIDPNHPF